MEQDVIARKREQVRRLYELGEVKTIGEIDLWIKKLTKAEENEALTHSYGPRAKVLSLLKAEPDDPQLLEFVDTMRVLGVDDRETKINFLIALDLQRARLSAESKIASDDAWAKNDYLITLQNAWVDGLRESWSEDNDHPEASRVFNELKRYTLEVDLAIEEERQNLLEKFSHYSDEDIDTKTIKFFIEQSASQAQSQEYTYWCLYLAARFNEARDVKFFESREAIDTYDDVFVEELMNAYNDILLNDIEGKD